MKCLIVFASTEGQTAKIATHIFDWLTAKGHATAVLPVGMAPDLAVGRYDAAIVAGSIHTGKYQSELVEWVTRARDPLAGIPTLFLSVSLAAAGDDASDWAGIRACADRFAAETGWTPGRTEHIAGALRFSEYDFLRYWAMRWIASVRDEEAVPGQDKEYTDWPALDALLEEWTAEVSAGK